MCVCMYVCVYIYKIVQKMKKQYQNMSPAQ